MGTRVSEKDRRQPNKPRRITNDIRSGTAISLRQAHLSAQDSFLDDIVKPSQLTTFLHAPIEGHVLEGHYLCGSPITCTRPDRYSTTDLFDAGVHTLNVPEI